MNMQPFFNKIMDTLGPDKVYKSISFTDKAYFANAIDLQTINLARLCSMTENLDLSGPFHLVGDYELLTEPLVKHLHIRGAYDQEPTQFMNVAWLQNIPFEVSTQSVEIALKTIATKRVAKVNLIGSKMICSELIKTMPSNRPVVTLSLIS
jgi:hypothetical protein